MSAVGYYSYTYPLSRHSKAMTAQRGGGYVVVASQRRTTHGYMQFLKIYNFQKLHIAAAPLCVI